MWVNPAHIARCQGKVGYYSAKRAEAKAKKATESSGEFIIAYECPDCGFWHIGHPDPCQFLVIPKALCKGCREPIPDGREDKFCTDQCKLDYVARKAHRNMLFGQAMGVASKPETKPLPLSRPMTGRLVSPQISPRPVYASSVDLSKITNYAQYTLGPKIEQKSEQENQVNNLSTSHVPHDLLGAKFGAFTVERRIKGKWEVRCVCGTVEQRSSKAVLNPFNTFDSCTECRRPVGKLRSDIFKETGVEVSWEDCFKHIYVPYTSGEQEESC